MLFLARHKFLSALALAELTQKALAKIVGVDGPVLSKMSRRHLPVYPALVERLVSALGIASIDEIAVRYVAADGATAPTERR